MPGTTVVDVQIRRDSDPLGQTRTGAARKHLVEQDGQQPAVHKARVSAQLAAQVRHGHDASAVPREPHVRRDGDAAWSGQRAGDEVRGSQQWRNGEVRSQFGEGWVSTEGLREGVPGDESVDFCVGGVGC